DDIPAAFGRGVSITAAFATGTDDRDVEAFVEILAAEERRRGAEDGTRGQRGVFDEVTTADGISRPGGDVGLWHKTNDYRLGPLIHKENFRFGLSPSVPFVAAGDQDEMQQGEERGYHGGDVGHRRRVEHLVDSL